ncbi:MAG: superoxide dismutase [Proteobacteria bacterium]|nr:superoxide dismutase [Pseudomonadota bacterium]
MTFELKPLPYTTNALEPHIDTKTMEIHHGKHHATYVTNLNNALKDQPELASRTLEELLTHLNEVPETIRTTVRNNGGGHWNHEFFWSLMTPDGSDTPSGDLAKEIDATFGSFAEFKAKLKTAGLGRFGSGWAWLIANRDGSLAIVSTPNQDNPLMEGKYAILGVDVWEHAYYLNYQNRRADYLDAWWSVVNWDVVAKLYANRK